MNEQNLIHFFRRQAPEETKRGWRCPDEATLAAYVDHTLQEPAGKKVEAHLAGCDFCLGQVALLAQLEDAKAPEEVPAALLARARELASRPAPASLWPVVRWGAVAAATASLALVVTLRVRQPETVPAVPVPSAPSRTEVTPSLPAPPPVAAAPSRVRNGQAQPILPELIFPRAEGAISREGLEFRWKEITQALFYEVRVVSEHGDLIWEGRATGTSLRPPAEVSLEAGQKYYVWVRAYLPEGKSLQSRAVAFRVGPNR